jgi:hypothetical protein
VTNAIELEKDTDEEEAYWLEFPRYGAVLNVPSVPCYFHFLGSLFRTSLSLCVDIPSFCTVSFRQRRSALAHESPAFF